MPVGVSAYVPLATKTLTATATSVTFSSISQAYRDLVLVIQTTSGASISISFNGDTSSTYATVSAYGNGTAAASVTPASAGKTYLSYGGAAGTLNQITTNIFDYSATDKHKTILSRADAASAGTEMIAGRWPSTAAITSFTMNFGGTWQIGSTFTLYGVAA